MVHPIYAAQSISALIIYAIAITNHMLHTASTYKYFDAFDTRCKFPKEHVSLVPPPPISPSCSRSLSLCPLPFVTYVEHDTNPETCPAFRCSFNAVPGLPAQIRDRYICAMAAWFSGAILPRRCRRRRCSGGDMGPGVEITYTICIRDV